MDAVNQGLHIGVSMRKFLRIKDPIADIILPSIIECDPTESQSLHGWQRVVDLLGLNRPAVSPRTPDCTESTIRRRGHLEALLDHETSVVGQGAEVVPLMDGGKGAKSMKTFARFQRRLMPENHGNAGMIGIWHRHRQRNQSRPRLNVSDCYSNIPAPDVDDRGAATVVTGIHAEKIFLLEISSQRHDPVWPFLVRTALVRPERGPVAIALRVVITVRAQLVCVVGPAF